MKNNLYSAITTSDQINLNTEKEHLLFLGNKKEKNGVISGDRMIIGFNTKEEINDRLQDNVFSKIIFQFFDKITLLKKELKNVKEENENIINLKDYFNLKKEVRKGEKRLEEKFNCKVEKSILNN